jgi:Secretory lipase
MAGSIRNVSHILRSAALLTLTSAVMASAASPSPDPWSGDGAVPGFYVWSDKIDARPGTVLRQEPLPGEFGLPAAGRATRILYVSSDWKDGHSIPVSGAVYFPKGIPPAAGWPIVAWAHGTTGVADVCAPSLMPRSARDVSYLDAWLEQGYAVVATDYPGLGTPGVHPYLLYRPEGLAVLDSIRAALGAWPKVLQNKAVAVGQSQGAGAALGAGYLAHRYAADVKLLGVVATGIVASVANPKGAPQLPQTDFFADPDYEDAAFAMLHFLGTDRAIDPSINPDSYVSQLGRPLLHAGLSGCMSDVVKVAKAASANAKSIYKKSVAALDQQETVYGQFPTADMPVPIFVGVGLADSAAGTIGQYNFISAMCQANVTVDWHYYPHASHTSAVERSLEHSKPFVAALMAGQPVMDRCAALAPPGPLQTPAQ